MAGGKTDKIQKPGRCIYNFFQSDSAGLKAEGFQSEALAEKKIIYIPAGKQTYQPPDGFRKLNRATNQNLKILL